MPNGNILAVYFGKVKGSRRHRPSILGHYGSLKSIVVAFFSIFWFTIHKCGGDWPFSHPLTLVAIYSSFQKIPSAYYIPGSMLVIRETTMTVNSFPNWKLPLHECKKIIYFLNSTKP